MKHFNLNTEGRDFFVGDIHGHYDEFMQALELVGFTFDTDRVFSVGDLIDRGPKSRQCLELLLCPWFHAVRGNHEDMMLGHQGYMNWMMNGGQWINGVEPNDIKALENLIIDEMPYVMTVQTGLGLIGIVHAESMSNWDDNPNMEINTWARHKLKYDHSATENIVLVVSGHTPLNKVARFSNHVMIDTGQAYPDSGGFLTLLETHEL